MLVGLPTLAMANEPLAVAVAVPLPNEDVCLIFGLAATPFTVADCSAAVVDAVAAAWPANWARPLRSGEDGSSSLLVAGCTCR